MRKSLEIDRLNATDALLCLLQKLGLCSMKKWVYMPSGTFVRRYQRTEQDRKDLRYE